LERQTPFGVRRSYSLSLSSTSSPVAANSIIRSPSFGWRVKRSRSKTIMPPDTPRSIRSSPTSSGAALWTPSAASAAPAAAGANLVS
jgi:hypothetical protein